MTLLRTLCCLAAGILLLACQSPSSDSRSEATAVPDPRKQTALAGISSLSAAEAVSFKESRRLVAHVPVTGEIASTDRRLDDGTLADVWLYEGQRGERLRIHLRSSGFDAYLAVLGRHASGPRLVGSDDDGGRGTDALLSVTLPEEEVYVIATNTAVPGQRGRYELLVESDARTSPEEEQPSAPDVSSAEPAGMSQIDYTALYPGGGAPSDRYALLVGIDDYPGRQNDLSSSVLDVQLMRTVLVESMGFPASNVVLLTNRDASRSHVLAAFARHLGQAGPDGTALFYLSGHGLQLHANLGVRAPLDTEEDQVDEAFLVWGRGESSSVILDDELGLLARQLTTDRALLILDTCHSGTGSRGAEGSSRVKQVPMDSLEALALPSDREVLKAASVSAATRETDASSSFASSSGVQELLRRPTRHLLLTAARADEIALAGAGDQTKDGQIRTSIFTHFLAEELRGAPPEMTFDALIQTVQQHTSAYVRARAGMSQTPQLEGTAGSERVHTYLGGSG